MYLLSTCRKLETCLKVWIEFLVKEMENDAFKNFFIIFKF